MAEEHQEKQLLEQIVRALVDNPDEVKVERQVDEMGVLLTLDLNPEDMGKVIGRQGRTARAIRTLLRVIGLKNHARVTLKINEPEGGARTGGSETSSEASDDESGGGSNVDDAMNELKV